MDEEAQTPPWTEDDTYDAFDNKGVPLANPDIYIPADQTGYTGYNQESNRGSRLVIRAATGNNITVSFYFSLALGKPVIEGGDRVPSGTSPTATRRFTTGRTRSRRSPARWTGPTIQGAEELIARDPGAHWDDSDEQGDGQRVTAVRARASFRFPSMTPSCTTAANGTGATADLNTANWIGFFIESTAGNGIWGRIIPIAGIRDGSGRRPTA